MKTGKSTKTVTVKGEEDDTKSQVSNANGPNKSVMKGAPVDQVVEEAPPEEENEEGAEEEEKKEETPENDVPEDNMQLVVAEADYSPLALERERLERELEKEEGKPFELVHEEFMQFLNIDYPQEYRRKCQGVHRIPFDMKDMTERIPRLTNDELRQRLRAKYAKQSNA